MDKLNSILLAVVASTGLFLASNSANNDKVDKPVAVVDYGKIIWELDQICVYSPSDQGMKIPTFTNEQTEQLTESLLEIETSIKEIMSEHHFSLVLRIDSLPVREPADFAFPVGGAELPKPKPKSEVNRLLSKRVVGDSRVDVTYLVIQKMREKRAKSK